MCFIFTGCVNEVPQPFAVYLSPGVDAGREMTVSWLVEGGVKKSEIALRCLAENGWEEYSVAGTKTKDFTVFSCTFSNLDANTYYTYLIGEWEGSFKTAGTDEAYSFVFLGDPQPDISSEKSAEEQYEIWANALAANASDSDFILLAGDLVNDSENLAEWKSFLTNSSTVFDKIPFVSAMGNHDNSEEFSKLMNFPNAGGIEDEYYSFDYENTHICIINSNNIIDEIAYEWLENDLKNSEADFKFVLMHHALYSAQSSGRDAQRAINLRDRFEELFYKSGVDMVFMGHEHVYMRTYPLYNEQIDDENGIIYLMGASSEKSYAEAQNKYAACFTAGEQVYTIVKVNGKKAEIKTYTNEGELIDLFTLDAG